MAKNYQVADLKADKGMTTARSNEHLRIATNGAYSRFISVNFDPSRVDINFEVTKGGRIIPVNKEESIPLRIKRNLKKRGIKDPNEKFKTRKEREEKGRRTIASFVLMGSRERMREMAFGNQQVNWQRGSDNSHVVCQEEFKRWAQDMYRFMAEKFGEENIVAFVAHLDETTPHIHCSVLPITKENKFSWKQVFHGETKEAYVREMYKFNDELAAVNEKYNLHRGESTQKTGARHRTTEQYRDWLDSLIQQNEEIVEAQRETITRQEKSISTNKDELYRLNDEIKQANKKVRGLTTMIRNLEERLSQTEANSKEYDELYRKLSERREQLTLAEQELQRLAGVRRDLKDNIEELQQKRNDMERIISQKEPDLESKVLKDMESTGWKIASEDALRNAGAWDELKRTLTPKQQKLFDEAYDGSIVEAMAQQANEIIAVSSALVLGYVDAAVTFAQSHGGGGGSPGGGWGRKKDDDDDMWNRRCFFMGMRMMRPKGKQLKR